SVAQLATQQFVSSALAAKANDSTVVHLSGNETILGSKQFAVAPSMPPPVQPNDGVNKQYVDSAVQNSDSGSYLSTSGGTLTGRLTLSSEKSEIRRSVYDRLLSAAVSALVSLAIAMHDHLGIH